MHSDKDRQKRHINPDHLAIVLLSALGAVFVLTMILAFVLPKETTPSELTIAEQTESAESTATSDTSKNALSYQAGTAAASAAPETTASASPSATASAETKATAKPSSTPESTATAESDEEDNADTSNLESLGSYDVNITSSLQADVSITDGTLRVEAVDESGKATTIFQETGPYTNSNFTATLPAGHYTINIYGNVTGWKFSFQAN